MNDWLLPITLLPGVGLLIMSTSSLTMGLSNELSLLINDSTSNPIIIRQKISQLSRLNLSLTAFYISSAALTISGLIGGLAANEYDAFEQYAEILLFLSILCILVALILLMIYSARAVRIKKRQFEERL